MVEKIIRLGEKNPIRKWRKCSKKNLIRATNNPIRVKIARLKELGQKESD